MRVVVADIEMAAAERVVAAIDVAGGTATPARVDVSDFGSLEALAERTRLDLGGAHLLVNNAGVLVMGSLADATLGDWDWSVGVNLMGVIHGVRAFLPQLLEASGDRHILNTGSINGLLPLPQVGVYSTSKYAVVGFSETLHAELPARGVGVSVLCPGGVRTQLLNSNRNRPKAQRGRTLSHDDVREVSDAVHDSPETAMDPNHVARIAFEGIHDDDLFILTHPNLEPMFEERTQRLHDAFEKCRLRNGSAA